MGRGLLLALLLVAMPAHAQHWVGSWSTSQLVPNGDSVTPPADLSDATVRQVVRLTLGGARVRVRLSNVFGTAPLTIGAASIAVSAGNATSRIDPASLRALRFEGAARATIPAGQEIWSDPVALPVTKGTDLAITLYLPNAPEVQTGHPGSRATSHFAHGDQVSATELADARTAPRWLVIGGVEVDAPRTASALVVLGDSITDGYGVPADSNRRWPDALATRLPSTMGVLNAGIGGNRILLDGLGPNALARLDRDVLSQPGVSHLIVLEGINDLGVLTRDGPATAEQHAALVRDTIAAFRTMIAKAHDRGILIYGGTIMPDGKSGYYHPGPEQEADRAAINAWIRAPGNFDGVIDFDAAMRDPANPRLLAAAYDSGDGLHPSVAGYEAMAKLVPLKLLAVRPKPVKKPVIAFTFDDLPAHAALPQGTTRIEIADRILGALAAAKAPATGLVNGVQLEREPASAPVLDAWRKAGQPLGSHGWSHANLDQISDAQFVEELVKNEPVLAAKMGKADWHWFRYPFLSEALADPARRARIRKLLAAHHYKVAAVTMDFGDWAYNDTYARCVAKDDQAAISRMEGMYLSAAETNANRSREMARALYGHDIPYVILMHLGAFDARMLPRLLALYQRMGFGFTTLAEAERDPYYASDVNPALPPQPQGLDGALRAKGLPVPPGAPLPPSDLCQ